MPAGGLLARSWEMVTVAGAHLPGLDGGDAMHLRPPGLPVAAGKRRR
ncbi:MAG: hypothetical protein ACP5G2_08490 [Candidatus Bipolaricaulaceae bacterium]